MSQNTIWESRRGHIKLGMDTNWLHFLAFINTAVTNMDLQMEFSEYIHRGGISRSYGSSIFNLLKSLQTDFHTVLSFTTPAVNRAFSFRLSPAFAVRYLDDRLG